MVQKRGLGEPIINIHSKYQNSIISAFQHNLQIKSDLHISTSLSHLLLSNLWWMTLYMNFLIPLLVQDFQKITSSMSSSKVVHEQAKELKMFVKVTSYQKIVVPKKYQTFSKLFFIKFKTSNVKNLLTILGAGFFRSYGALKIMQVFGNICQIFQNQIKTVENAFD